MGSEVGSILLGTSGLTFAALVALALTCARPNLATEYVPRIRRIAALAVLLQLAHFGEEYLFQFYVRFPELLGLVPWSAGFFVAFNLAWFVVWCLAIASIARFPRGAAFPLWFLAIASAANGIIHPLLALAVGAYFPGLWSSPFVGILGAMLLSAMASATSPGGREPGAD